MNCSEVRDRLMSGEAWDEAVESHLAGCPSCETFAARLDATVAALGRHHAGSRPDAGFAARVVAALPETPELLGWAALRLLPAAGALALVLTGWCLIGVPGPSDLVEESPTDDLLSWVLETEEGGS